MAYNLNRTGDNVAELLEQVENKTIYSNATEETSGLLSAEDKTKLNSLTKVEYATTAFWNSCRGFIPERGQIIVYSDYKTIQVEGETKLVPGIKIGSGNGYVQDLAFVTDSLAKDLLAHINDDDKHVSYTEKQHWNNKLNVNDFQEVIGETLVFNRN